MVAMIWILLQLNPTDSFSATFSHPIELPKQRKKIGKIFWEAIRPKGIKISVQVYYPKK
jgi:hypothetical protein